MDALERVRAISRAVLEFPERMKVSHPDYIEGERLFGLGKFAEAESYFQNACMELKANTAPRGHQARTLLRIAQTQWKQKKIAKARVTADSAQALLTVKPKPSSDLSACLDLLGSLQGSEGDAEGAREHFRQALEVQKRIFPIQPVPLTERYRRLALALAEVAPSEAQALYNQAVKIAEQRMGTCASVTADCLLDLGRFELLHADKESGSAFIERAIEINKEASGEISDEVARALQFAASSFQEADDLERAVAYYELALKVRERQLGGNAADFATLLMGLAETHTLLGNDAPAMELLQQAVGKLANSGGELYAAALENLGEAYWGLGHIPDAVSCLKKARAIWENDPIANEDALKANSALLEQATQYVPAEPGSAGPLFKPGPRLREPTGPQKTAANAFPRRPQPQDNAFSFGSSPSTGGLRPRVGWMPASLSSEADEKNAHPLPSTGPVDLPVSVMDIEQASTPPVASNPLPISQPVPAAIAGGKLLVSFVNSDGSPIESGPPASPQEPVQMTIIVPEQGLPRQVVLTPANTTDPELEIPKLSGWQELSFEFLSIS